MTDQGGELRYTGKGRFVNDADMSEFDPDSQSPTILEAEFLALEARARLCMKGEGDIRDLVVVIEFLVAQHAPMRAHAQMLVERLEAALLKHERKRSGVTRQRKPKPVGKRALAAAAAQRASELVGMEDASLPTVWTQKDAEQLLKYRSVVVSSTEYEDDDNARPADELEVEWEGVITTVLESSKLLITFADDTTEEMLIETAIPRLKKLSSLSRDELGELPKRVLLFELKARGLPASAKSQAQIADALKAEFERVESAVPAGVGDRVDAGDADQTVPETDRYRNRASGDADADGDGQPGDGEGGIQAVEETATGAEDESSCLEAALRRSAEHANQQQLIVIEKLFAKVNSAVMRLDALTKLLLRLGWPCATAAAGSPVAAPTPGSPVAAPTPGSPVAAPDTPPTLPRQQADAGSMLTLTQLVQTIPEVVFEVGPASPSFVFRLSSHPDLCQIATQLAARDGLLRSVVTWMRHLATKLLVFKVADAAFTLNATVGMFGIPGQMSQDKLQLAKAYMLRRLDAASVDSEVMLLNYDGERCNISKRPPGRRPESLAELSDDSQAVLDRLKPWLKHSAKKWDVPRILQAIRDWSAPVPLPRNLKRLGYVQQAPMLDAPSQAQIDASAAARQLMIDRSQRYVVAASLLRRARLMRQLPQVAVTPLGVHVFEPPPLPALREKQFHEEQLAFIMTYDADGTPMPRARAEAMLQRHRGDLAAVKVELDIAADASGAWRTGKTPDESSIASSDAPALSAAPAAGILHTEDAESAAIVESARWFSALVDRYGSISAAIERAAGMDVTDPWLKRVLGEHAKHRPLPQQDPLYAAVPLSADGWDVTIGGAAVPSFDQLLQDASYLFPEKPHLAHATLSASGGRVSLALRPHDGLAGGEYERSGPAAPTAWVTADVLLREQRLRGVEEAVRAGRLSVPQLLDELLLRIFEYLRLQAVAQGSKLGCRFYSPLPRSLIEAECQEHKDKNFIQVVSRVRRMHACQKEHVILACVSRPAICALTLALPRSQLKEDLCHVISREKIVQVARKLYLEDTDNFTLLAAFLRTTDMQSAPAMQQPLICPGFMRALQQAGCGVEHAILHAMGCGTRGFTFPSLPPVERARLIELVRTNMVANLYGEQLCMPFGGGEKRSREARVGVRAASVRGLAGSNLRALLQGADAVAAFRDRYPELLERLSYDLFNTNDLELGFSILWQLCNGCKPEFFQLKSMQKRQDFLEQTRANPDTPLEAKRRKRGSSKCALPPLDQHATHAHATPHALHTRQTSRAAHTPHLPPLRHDSGTPARSSHVSRRASSRTWSTTPTQTVRAAWSTRARGRRRR